MGGKTASSRDANMRELIAKYLPKAKRGARTTPLLVVDTGAGAAAPIADLRAPRSRPDDATVDQTALAYAAEDTPHDVVSRAMAEPAKAEASAPMETAEGDIGEAPEDDPIAHRIEVASAVAEFADITVDNGGSDPIGRLTKLARLRAGVQDIVATGPARAEDDTSEPDEAGWNIQIGAVPTAEGAQALIEKAQATMGTVLASLQPADAGDRSPRHDALPRPFRRILRQGRGARRLRPAEAQGLLLPCGRELRRRG